MRKHHLMAQRILHCFLFAVLAVLVDARLEAADSAIARPSPTTVRDWQSRKYGMFIHFGLYSMLGGVWKGREFSGNYSEQVQSDAHIPSAEYAELASRFNPDHWNPDAVVELAQDAGMQFIVLTSKHHDGFSMFHTGMSTFNVADGSPYKRDIVKGLADACARHHMPFGVYYSTIDWHFGDPPDRRNDNPITEAHEEFNVAQLRELMTGYGPISEIWFDMGHPTKLQSKHFADTVHALQSECLISGRVWNNQGDFMEMGDDEIPDYILDEPWESPASIYQETWGYRSWLKRTNLEKKIQEHILRLVAVVSRGGNYILNIGPRGDGSVVEFEAAVLRGTGTWLKRNREAIYGTQPQPFRKLDFGYATVKHDHLFLFVEHPPANGRLELPGFQNHIRNAYVLSDPAQRPLNSDDAKDQKAVIAPASLAREFLPVVVAEFDGEIKVVQPAVAPGPENSIVLTPETADRFYNTNGEGYYDSPTLRKEQWHFAVSRPDTYRIQVSYRPGKFARLLDINVGGRVYKANLHGNDPGPAGIGTIQLEPSQDMILTVGPASPAERGASLDVELARISLIPSASP
jgi:alpha-L-fucosidase